ncbi:hypothetical protein UA08_02838 [Talaromyces atroroseus]|uniref:Increased loss of mitochondrial DNA protein 1 n=1 Tax=Talaromyces atroroseus TaxID=1441469 RepID=A0A225B4U7_TALAT|nr:hypothetical protein UA08_02838 [Talaromyces atroroseus]OKL61885.1 hypothetical protein UA08_02838 [Talaromyces atroroseus]
MALLSSQTLIQAHALFLFILAVYLVVSPGAVTDSDIVFILGEAMQIDIDTSLATTAQFPFAICGILLISQALFDLIIVRKLPQVEDLIINTPRQRSRLSSSGEGTINPFMVRLATLYNEIWSLLAGLRFCFFFAIAIFIYQSRPGAGSPQQAFGYDGTEEMKQGLAQLKSRVVFTFVFEETVFWLWTLANVREERRDIANRLAIQQAAERERGPF